MLDSLAHPSEFPKVRIFRTNRLPKIRGLKILTVLAQSRALEKTGWRETISGSGTGGSIKSFGA